MPLNKSTTSVCFLMLVLAASMLSLAAVTPKAKALILYNSGNPTPEEQLVLEYINRARANPIAEGQRLGIDIHEGLVDDPQDGCYGPEYVGVRPPLAMNPALLAIAEGHSEDMYNQNYFSHTDPNGTTAFQRMANAGYNYVSAGENIGAGADMSATDLEDALMLDSGYPCRAHRMNLLDIFPYPPPAYYEVGIGYYEGSSGQAFITQDFGTAVDTSPFLTGVVYNDANGNGFYDIGEGIAGVTITPSSGNYYAVSSSSGGYAFPIPTSGTITVTASGNGFGPITQTVTLTGTNIELDFTPRGTSATTVTTSSQPTAQTSTQYTTQATQSVTQRTSTSTQSTQSVTQTSASTIAPPLLQSVTFQSSPSDFLSVTSPGTITACGNTYSYFHSADACGTNFAATANLPNPAAGWVFDHWTWEGGVACSSDTANPASCSAYNSGGVLIAVYAARVTVLTNPASSASVNWGSCSSLGEANGASFFNTNFGIATVTACNIPAGYSFLSWTCSGGITCQASTNPATVTFTGPGAITLNLQPRQTTSTSTASSLTTSSVAETTTASSQSTSSISTQMTPPAIPGFSWESILAGIFLGMIIIALVRRRSKQPGPPAAV